MSQPEKLLLSYVIPCYNECENVAATHSALSDIAASLEPYQAEFVYINDGSSDGTLYALQELAVKDHRVRVISFSRNFGKEIATTAGIRQASGQAVIILDADGQHPADMIPEFIKKWQTGAQVVVGVRHNTHGSRAKQLTSRAFYRLFNSQSDLRLVPGSTDFRLIDRVVQQQFITLTEHNRITRGLIDWLGFRREYVYFDIAERSAGNASYSAGKLIGLAMNSFVSLSLRPLYLLAYAGLAALAISTALGIFSAIEMLTGDPLGLDITGTAYLVLLVLFLVGIILISQGVLALYISHIHTESKNRPLYVIDPEQSRGLS